MKIHPYCQRQKCRPMTLVSGVIRFIRRFLGRGHQTRVGLSRTVILSVFAGYFFRYLEMRPALSHSNTQSVVSFSVIPKCMTLNGYFVLNSVFPPVWLALTMRLSINYCAKTNKGRHSVSDANLRRGL